MNIDKTKSIIQEALSKSENPIIFWSGGKDSTVMLYMVKEFCPDIEVVYLFDKNMMDKNMWAFQMAADLDLKMNTYPPSSTDYIQKEDYFEVLHFYYIDGSCWHTLYNGCVKYKPNEPYICVVKDLLNIPTIDKFNHKWDCIFHGQKQCESAHIIDSYKIPKPIVNYGYGVMAMPLYDWTDKDIWAYIRKHNIPYQKDRYLNNIDGTETGDERDKLNNDVIPTCFDCIDYRNEGQAVVCSQTKELMGFQGKTEQVHKDFMDLLLSKMTYMEAQNG